MIITWWICSLVATDKASAIWGFLKRLFAISQASFQSFIVTLAFCFGEHLNFLQRCSSVLIQKNLSAYIFISHKKTTKVFSGLMFLDKIIRVYIFLLLIFFEVFTKWRLRELSNVDSPEIFCYRDKMAMTRQDQLNMELLNRASAQPLTTREKPNSTSTWRWSQSKTELHSSLIPSLCRTQISTVPKFTSRADLPRV